MVNITTFYLLAEKSKRTLTFYRKKVAIYPAGVYNGKCK